MANKRSESSNYQSPSTGEYCTCAQYVAEIMCTRMAQKENKGTPAFKFWNTKKWKTTYQHQVILANRLIKKHGPLAVVKAVNSPALKKVYSLRYPHIDRIVREHKQIIEKEEITKPAKINEQALSRKKSYGKKSVISRLRNIDGKKDNK